MNKLGLVIPCIGERWSFLGQPGHCPGPKAPPDLVLASPPQHTVGEKRHGTSRRAAAARLVRVTPLGGGQVAESGSIRLRSPRGHLFRSQLLPATAHCVRDHHWNGRHDDEEVESD
jgi:hypothetical protein